MSRLSQHPKFRKSTAIAQRILAMIGSGDPAQRRAAGAFLAGCSARTLAELIDYATASRLFELDDELDDGAHTLVQRVLAGERLSPRQREALACIAALRLEP